MAAGAVGYVEKRVGVDQLVTEVLAAASLSAAVADRVSVDLDQSLGAPRAARDLVRTFLEIKQYELNRARLWTTDWEFTEYTHHL